MGVRETLFAGDRSRRADGPVRLLQLRRLRERVQVAAVCYRVGRKGIEFLLVQTRGSGRWTFPKGGTEPGLTHAQAAAVEAFEEAGVHGRIEEASFARYLRRKKGRCKDSNSPTVATKAHLCEVLWRDSPEETGRNPSWFSPEKAKQRLRQERSADFAAEIARVVDHAVARIQRLRSAATASDTLQKVQFEFFERTNNHGWGTTWVFRDIFGTRGVMGNNRRRSNSRSMPTSPRYCSLRHPRGSSRIALYVQAIRSSLLA